MSEYIVKDTELTSIANAIRSKSGGNSQLEFPSSFVSEIGNLGSYTGGDWMDRTKPIGNITSNIIFDRDDTSNYGLLKYRSGITRVSMPETIWFPDDFFMGCSNLQYVSADKAEILGASTFKYNTSLTYAIFPKAKRLYTETFTGCSSLLAADFGGTPGNGDGFIRRSAFSNCSKINVLVLRSSVVWTLSYTSVFDSSPFASGGTGGTLYVPNDLIASYQSATNWSTILGYTNNQIKSIESTHTDPNAEIDLTTHYIDGTLIPTS